MLESINTVAEAESNTAQNPKDLVALADLQLTLVGGGSGIAQLD
jgi:hypothetical protein